MEKRFEKRLELAKNPNIKITARKSSVDLCMVKWENVKDKKWNIMASYIDGRKAKGVTVSDAMANA